MADYPDSIYSPRTRENKSGVEYDVDKKTVLFVEDIDKGDDETVAIETELGTDPKSGFSDVAERLDAGDVRSLTFIIDGGGAEISTGLKGFLIIPFKCVINSVTLLADQNGAIVVDIWKDTYGNFPPTDADSITASAPPTITASGDKSRDTTMTAWTTTIEAGSILAFNVDSVETIERLTLALKVTLSP